MKINNFSGGLSTRRSPRAIDGAQATICKNVDFTSLDIRPFMSQKTVSDYPESGEVFYDFAGRIFASSSSNVFAGQSLQEYLEYGTDLYLIDKVNTNGTGQLKRLQADDSFKRSGFRRDYLDINIVPKQNFEPNLTENFTAPAGLEFHFNTGREVDDKDPIDKMQKLIDSGVLPFADKLDQSALSTSNIDLVNSAIDHLATAGKPPKTNPSEPVNPLIDLVQRLLDIEGRDTYVDYTIVFNSYSVVTTTQYNDTALPAYEDGTLKRIEFVNGIMTFDASLIRDGVALARIGNSSSININVPARYTPSGENRNGDKIGGEEISPEKVINTNLQTAGNFFFNAGFNVPVPHTYQYVVTLHSSTNLFESSYIDEIFTFRTYETDGVCIGIDEPFDLLADTYMDTIRVYRLGNGATSLTLVYEELIANKRTFGTPKTDLGFGLHDYHIQDTDLTNAPYLRPLGNKLFDTLAVGETPLNIKQAIEVGNRIVTFEGAILYGSELGNRDSYPLVNTVEFNQEIVGIAESSRGLLVFFPYKTYVINLTNSGRYIKVLLSGDQGCTTYRSIAHIGNKPYWTSHEGICSIMNSRVAVVSKTHLDAFNFKPVHSGVFNEKYYCLVEEGKALVLDARFGNRTFYDIDFEVPISYLTILQGKFYGVIAGRAYELFAGTTPLTYEYQTGLLEDNDITNLKTFDDIYVRRLDEEDCVLTVTSDRNEVMSSGEMTEYLNNFKVKTEAEQVYGAVFNFKGTARVAELDYTVEGRQNGR